MIEGAYILKGNGDVLYGVEYSQESEVSHASLPSHVQACVTLFTSRDSTVIGQPYTLEQGDRNWVYVFFESFTVVVRVAENEDITSLSRRMVALGRELAQNYGHIMSIWSGYMGEIEGIDTLVDHFMTSESLPTETELKSVVNSLLDMALEKQDLAYVGVIDAAGNMLGGNIPENHLIRIRDELVHEAVKPSADIVPTVYHVLGYDVQVLRVKSLTVVGAPQKDASRVGVTTLVSELAQSLSDMLVK